MWWNHSWKVRWIGMFCAGAMVAKAGGWLLCRPDPGVGTQLAPGEMPEVISCISLNGFIFCHIVFWSDVEEWFERQP
jgi:hypothetical protein